MGCQEEDGEKKERETETERRYVHELPYTEMVKSGTIRLALGINRKSPTVSLRTQRKEVHALQLKASRFDILRLLKSIHRITHLMLRI